MNKEIIGYTTAITVLPKQEEVTHNYVEIGGIKWATMNLGANSITDYGLYFQWGDIQGYTADQIGSGEGQKRFDWNNYKYGDGFNMTKYNNIDNKDVLDMEDDAAQQLLGGSWRMPTSSEFTTLKESTNIEWTQINGVYGMLCVDKQDINKTLFFPASGYGSGTQIQDIGKNGNYWTNLVSPYSDKTSAFRLRFYNDGGFYPASQDSRVGGYSIRAVLD